MQNDRMIIRLREIRDAHNMTPADVAERLGVSDSQISRWETGVNNIPSKKLPKIAKAYKCKVSDIFSDEDDIDLSSVGAAVLELTAIGRTLSKEKAETAVRLVKALAER